MKPVSRSIDHVEATFDDPTLVADAGLIVPATLMMRLGVEGLVNGTVRLVGRVGGALPGRKVLTLVAVIVAGGTHIDHGLPTLNVPSTAMSSSTAGACLRAPHDDQAAACAAEGTSNLSWTHITHILETNCMFRTSSICCL